MNHQERMQVAIDQARESIEQGQTPFGAAIYRGEELIAAGHNEVWHRCDPTAHAEVVAIQRGASATDSIDLSGCEMYTTCEPCPMCAAAIHWCRLDAVYHGATIADAERAGFNELTLPATELYRQGGSEVRVVTGVLQEECAKLFDEWIAAANSKTY
jgi:tRNA(Arg) A34 adenosine deaminase TadA